MDPPYPSSSSLIKLGLGKLKSQVKQTMFLLHYLHEVSLVENTEIYQRIFIVKYLSIKNMKKGRVMT